MIKVGDIVRITDEDECYNDSVEAVAEHVSDNLLCAGYDLWGRPSEGETGKVVAMWSEYGDTSYYVRLQNSDGSLSPYCYIMNQNGIELCEPDIAVGDIVQFVWEVPDIYPSYISWVAKNVEDKEKIAKYAYCSPSKKFDRDDRFAVVAIAKHGKCSKTLAYVERCSFNFECYLVGIDQIKKVK